MRILSLFALLTLLSASCRHDEDPLATTTLKTPTGTYEVTRLTQYQNGQKTFDGYLPYLLADNSTITHRIGISLGSPQPDGTAKAYIIREWYRTGPRGFIGNHGGNIGGLSIIAKQLSEPSYVEFYRDGVTKIGTFRNAYTGQTLTFDLVEPDSLNQLIRYVFEAKKISDDANRF